MSENAHSIAQLKQFFPNVPDNLLESVLILSGNCVDKARDSLQVALTPKSLAVLNVVPPPHWDNFSGYLEVPLCENSEEYKFVTSRFVCRVSPPNV